MLSPFEIILRLIIATTLGSVVGLERERKEGAAGLRTHMLVCLGSALMMIVSAFGFSDVVDKPGIVLDPSRIAAQVVSGIGFLGAGTILFLRPQIVRGLTTAAGLWGVAGVGLAVGGGLYLAASTATLIIVIVLALIKPLEDRFIGVQKRNQVVLTVNKEQRSLSQIENTINLFELVLKEIRITSFESAEKEQITLIFQRKLNTKKILLLIEKLKSLPYVESVSSLVK
ncbi:MAG: MgtC/SapB family protein [Ilyomonas sp.]